MPTLDERVTNNEAEIASTESLVRELTRSTLRFQQEMSGFKNEMSDFKTEMSDFKNEMSDFKTEMSDFKKEMEADRKRMNKAWGDLANKLGTIIEDIVAPNIRRLASERFQCEPLESFFVRALRRGPDGVMREFDVIAVGDRRVVLAESKSTITAQGVIEFTEKVRTFFDHFPEWRGRELIPVLASWRVEEPGLVALNAHRIFGLEMGDETMRLVNDGDF